MWIKIWNCFFSSEKTFSVAHVRDAVWPARMHARCRLAVVNSFWRDLQSSRPKRKKFRVPMIVVVPFGCHGGVVGVYIGMLHVPMGKYLIPWELSGTTYCSSGAITITSLSTEQSALNCIQLVMGRSQQLLDTTQQNPGQLTTLS